MCARVEWLIICINYLSVYAGAEELFASLSLHKVRMNTSHMQCASLIDAGGV